MPQILVLHGPNLNLLGTREPEHYGSATLEDINRELSEGAAADGLTLDAFQSNSETALIDAIHQAPGRGVEVIIINPAALTHTSVALRDALSGVGIPFIEVHLSNVHARESFRQHSYLSEIASGVIVGFGSLSYRLALHAAVSRLQGLQQNT